MRLGQKLRQIWHDIFYSVASQKSVEFAMRCKDVAHQVDFHTENLSTKDKLRFYLHLSLCQACKNYYSFSSFLSSNIKKISIKDFAQSRIDKLNQDLLNKYKPK